MTPDADELALLLLNAPAESRLLLTLSVGDAAAADPLICYFFRDPFRAHDALLRFHRMGKTPSVRVVPADECPLPTGT